MLHPGPVKGSEGHPVGVERQAPPPVHHQILVQVKVDLMHAEHGQALGGLHLRGPGIDRIGVDRLRVLTHEPEQDRLVAAVPMPGRAE